MNRPRPRRLCCLRSSAPWIPLGLTLLCLPAALQAQPLPPGMPPNATPATVTKAMGEVGGKYFGQAPDPPRPRRYFIAIEPEFWDYAPQGVDPVCGIALPP